MKTRDCADCKHFIEPDEWKESKWEARPTCAKGMKLRFYEPKTKTIHSGEWGWKRRCNDFEEQE